MELFSEPMATSQDIFVTESALADLTDVTLVAKANDQWTPYDRLWRVGLFQNRVG